MTRASRKNENQQGAVYSVARLGEGDDDDLIIDEVRREKGQYVALFHDGQRRGPYESLAAALQQNERLQTVDNDIERIDCSEWTAEQLAAALRVEADDDLDLRLNGKAWTISDGVLHPANQPPRCVWSLSWDSGGPGAGAGSESVLRSGNRYYYSSSDYGTEGPYPSLRATLDQHDSLCCVTDAVSDIDCSGWAAEQIARALSVNADPGHRVLLNDELWIVTAQGGLRPARPGEED